MGKLAVPLKELERLLQPQNLMKYERPMFILADTIINFNALDLGQGPQPVLFNAYANRINVLAKTLLELAKIPGAPITDAVVSNATSNAIQNPTPRNLYETTPAAWGLEKMGIRNAGDLWDTTPLGWTIKKARK